MLLNIIKRSKSLCYSNTYNRIIKDRFMKSIFVLLATVVPMIMNSCGDKSTVYKKAAVYNDTKNYSQGIVHFQTVIGHDFNKALAMLDAHHFILEFYDRMGRLHEGINFYRKLSYPGLKQDRKLAVINTTNTKYERKPSNLYFMYKGFQEYIGGIAAFLQKDYPSALNKLKSANEVLDNKLKGYIVNYYLGLTYIKLGDKAVRDNQHRWAKRYFFYAKAALTRVVKKNEDFHMGFYYLGLLHAYKYNNIKVGKALLKKSLSKFPVFEKEAKIDLIISLGRLSLLNKNLNKAMSYYNKALTSNFDKVARSVDMGSLYVKQGDNEKAKSYWSRAINRLGHNSPRGRYYLKKLCSMKGDYVDFSGVAFSFPGINWDGKEHFIIGDENKLAFKNPKDKKLYYSLLRGRLIDRRYGYEAWIIEKDKFRSERKVIRRWMQNRGILKKLKFDENHMIYVSVYQQKYRVKKPGLFLDRYKTNKRLKTPSYVYWRLKDPRFGIYKNGKRIQVLNFKSLQFIDAQLVDIDGDKTKELVAAGVVGRNRMELIVYKYNKASQKWSESTRLSTDLEDNRNGFLLLQLDATPALELIRFSDLVSWADVFTLKNGKYIINNKVYPHFIKDFVKRYSFFTDSYVQREIQQDKLKADLQLLYKSYAKYVKRGVAFLQSI